MSLLPINQFDDLLKRLPGDFDVDELARQTKNTERSHKVFRGALYCASHWRAARGLSLSATTAWATMKGLAEMSDPEIKYRLDKAVGFLEAVMCG